jgi:hypothetical protein
MQFLNLPKDILAEIGWLIPDWTSFIAYTLSCKDIRGLFDKQKRQRKAKALIMMVAELETKTTCNISSDMRATGSHLFAPQCNVIIYQVFPLSQDTNIKHGSFSKWKLIDGITKDNYDLYRPYKIGQYRNNYKEDVWEGWFTTTLDGKDQSHRFFKKYRKGEIHGQSTAWYSNGIIRSVRQYKHGYLHGITRTWLADGNPTSSTYYCNNQLMYECDDNGDQLIDDDLEEEINSEESDLDDDDRSIDYPDEYDECSSQISYC